MSQDAAVKSLDTNSEPVFENYCTLPTLCSTSGSCLVSSLSAIPATEIASTYTVSNITTLSSTPHNNSIKKTPPKINQKKRKYNNPPSPSGRDVVEAAVARLSAGTQPRPKTDSEIFGEMIGSELQLLSPRQKMHAKKLMFDTIYLASNKSLNSDSYIGNKTINYDYY